MTAPPPDDLARVGALSEPTRRALYEFVAGRPGPTSREEAASAVGVPVHSAKFHLDRLVAEGLLETEFRRLTGRSGPGAGRPAKLYRRAGEEVSVSLPPRAYDLAGAILAAAIERATSSDTSVADAVHSCAHEAGTRIGEEARPTGSQGLSRLAEALSPHGYEPRVDDGEEADLVLANCPFDRLAQEHRDLVCSMNLRLVQGVIEGGRCNGVVARLQPESHRCCVTAHAEP